MVDLASRFISELIAIQQTADKGTFLFYLWAILVSLPEIVKSRSLFPADKKMVDRNCFFWPLGNKITISGQDFGLAREIYCGKCYFVPYGFEIPANGVVIDLGANVGIFTVLAALHASKVIAVECRFGFIELMENNLINNNCFQNAIVEFGLIGAKSGVFSDKARLIAASHYNAPPPQLSFAEILKRHDVDNVDFLKIDIEGSKFDLFDEDTSWLEKVTKIAMEVHLEFGDINTIIETLKYYNFEIWLANKNGIIVSELKEPIGYLFAKIS